MNDVFGEVLKFEQLFALFLEFDALAAEGLREKTGEVGDSEETEEIAEKPDAQALRSRNEEEGARNSSRKSQSGHSAKNQKAYRGSDKGHLAREEDAGHDDDQQVEGDERAFLETGGVNERRNDKDVAGDLQNALPASSRHPADQRDVNNPKENPGKQKRQEREVAAGSGDVLRPAEAGPKEVGESGADGHASASLTMLWLSCFDPWIARVPDPSRSPGML